MAIYTKKDIQQILPQSDPLLLVDQAEVVDENTVTGQVYVDPGWDVFRGHFKDEPILPGVYILEAMAQTADVLLLSDPKQSGKYPILSGCEHLRCIRPVYPDQRMTMRASIRVAADQQIFDFDVAAYCDEKKVASALITLVLK